jgi:hypothetical protein
MLIVGVKPSYAVISSNRKPPSACRMEGALSYPCRVHAGQASREPWSTLVARIHYPWQHVMGVSPTYNVAERAAGSFAVACKARMI